MSKTERKKLAATAAIDKPHTRIDVAKEWLASNYVVRVNLLDRSKLFIKAKEECPITYEHPITEDDIMIHAFADELPIPRNMLKLVLQSPNYMQSYNPIRDYLNGLQGTYRGPSQIDLLCSALHIPEEQGGRQATTRAHYILRKWLVATAACALGIRQNDVALGLVGDKAGIGKTSFFENIVPHNLKEYYQVAQKDDRPFSLHNSFAHRFILNFDEFAAINKNNEQIFKQLMSAKEIEIRRPGSRYTETVPRVATCCFTSNKNHRNGGFIKRHDQGILRRLAVIEVDAIDDYRKELDVDQLWAEVVTLLQGGTSPDWTQEEYQQFVEENRQYVEESNALRLLRLYYRMPEIGEIGVFMTAMEIVMQLKEKRKLSSATQHVNEVTVGQALSVLGFKSCSARNAEGKPRYGYYIIPLYDNNS